MSGLITIRNLTTHPLTVKLVERYEAPISQDFPPNAGFSVSNITSHVTNFFFSSNASSLATPNLLDETAQSFTQQDVDLRMEPFTTHRTDIQTTERGPNEILRLTFHGDGGGRWRIDTPTPSGASQLLTPLTPNPKHEYMAIYLPSSSFLALYERTDPQCWMRALADATPLAALSIPGTHNSPACHRALPSVRCQAVPPRAQLEHGVRFLDVRVRVRPGHPHDPTDDTLQLVHGVFPVALTGPQTFRDLVREVQGFLAQHPSETVLVSVKREGAGSATDDQLAAILREHYTSSSPPPSSEKDTAAAARWYTDPHIPTLGAARGKIVLVRRFGLSSPGAHPDADPGWALDAAAWPHNTPRARRGAVDVQDWCEVLDPAHLPRKVEVCCAHLARAARHAGPSVLAAGGGDGGGMGSDGLGASEAPLFLNFLSASNFWKVGCWPERIAARVNPAVRAFLCERHGAGEGSTGAGGVGIVVCDWVGRDGDWDLVRCIVAMNGRLLLKQRGMRGDGDGEGEEDQATQCNAVHRGEGLLKSRARGGYGASADI